MNISPLTNYVAKTTTTILCLPPPSSQFVAFVDCLLHAISSINDSLILTALLYLTRMTRNLRGENVFILFLAAVILADITLNDNAYNLSFWSSISNVSIPDIVAIKISCLELMQYQLNVTGTQYLEWIDHLLDISQPPDF